MPPSNVNTLEARLPRLLARVFESTTEGMIITDAAGDIIMVNPAFTQVTGYSLDEVPIARKSDI